MKILPVIALIFFGVVLTASQDTTRDCINNVVIVLEVDLSGDWVRDLNDTVERLQDQKRRCEEMTNLRLQEACLVAWRASVGLELTRLGSDLRVIAGEEKSAEFLRLAAECFGVEPPQPEEPVFEKPE